MGYPELVEKLTREHRVVIMRDDGSRSNAVEDGLIRQLRDAVVSGNSKSGASSNKSRLPLDAASLDLLSEIQAEANQHWVDVSGGRASDPDAVETIIALWAAAMGDGSELTLQDWVNRITDLLNPPSVAEIDAPCVSCGVRDVLVVRGGTEVVTRALRFVRDRETNETREARCLACGESWRPDQFLWFARAIAAGTTETTVSKEDER